MRCSANDAGRPAGGGAADPAGAGAGHGGRARRGFDLAETWRSIVDTLDERRVWFHAIASANAEAVPWLRSAFGRRVTVGEPGPDGRVELELRSWSAGSLASELAPFGTHVEVIEPQEVRRELASLGKALTGLYRTRRGSDGGTAPQIG